MRRKHINHSEIRHDKLFLHRINKVLFAQKYVELIQAGNEIPNWIQEIKNYF
jgi:hypothetical protein